MLLCAAWLAAAQAQPCDGTPQTREATSRQIRDFVRASGKQLITFVGYSGAGYEDPAAMRAAAEQVLAGYDPARTLVNIGGTAAGIGEVYALAKRRGFATLGIVSSLARDGGEPLSPCVDQVFFVRDASWGGRAPGSKRLAPTSAAIVANSHALIGIGGGEIARDELLAARAAGKPVRFVPADMNHAAARDKARAKGQSEPVDFRGAAHASLAPPR
ncbi:MAG TPA: hypothetical protein PKB14_24315 [Rubrivivax sp.]|nr:hypothetical protein [Rubrivivax sp.]